MNNFKTIYKILKYLEASLDTEEFDGEPISAERLGISRERLEQLLIMMQDEGYIKGLVIDKILTESKRYVAVPIRPEITIRGLEYLADNSMMKKAADILRGVAYLIP